MGKLFAILIVLGIIVTVIGYAIVPYVSDDFFNIGVYLLLGIMAGLPAALLIIVSGLSHCGEQEQPQPQHQYQRSIVNPIHNQPDPNRLTVAEYSRLSNYELDCINAERRAQGLCSLEDLYRQYTAEQDEIYGEWRVVKPKLLTP